MTNAALSGKPNAGNPLCKAVKNLLLAGVLVGMLPAWAANWTTGTWSTFTPASGNLIKGKTPSTCDLKNPAEGKHDAAVYTDGLGPTKNSDSTCVGNNATLTYTLDYPSRLDSLRFYTSAWTGRNNITIASILYQTTEGAWVTIDGSSVNYAVGGASCGSATFANDDGSPLGTMVQRVTVNFGAQENGYVGFVEIEMIGQSLDYRRIAVNPEGCVTPSPDVGLTPFTSGVEVTLTAPAGPTLDDSGFYFYTLTGYDLKFADGTTSGGSSASLTFTPTQAYTLTWNYQQSANPSKDVPSRALIGRYVQDGFFGFWDVLYNVGTNAAHSNAATVWKDIVGTHDMSQFTNPSSTKIPLPSWEDNRLVWDGNASGQAFACSGGDGNLLADNMDVTLEFVGECTSYGGDNISMFVMSKDGTDYDYGTVPLAARMALSNLYCSYGGGQDATFPFTSVVAGNGSYAVTFVTEGKNVKFYYRGELYKTLSNIVTVRTIKNLVLGAPCYGSYKAGAKFALRGVRLYDRALTAGEVRHNHAIDNARYYEGKICDTVIFAQGTPANYGEPSPAYGTTVATSGNTLKLSAGLLNTYDDTIRARLISSAERAVYLGYAVKTSGVEVASGTAENAQWQVIPAQPGSVTMDWRWRREFRLSAAQSGYAGCTVEIVGATTGGAAGDSTAAWAPDGGVVTIRAVACQGAKFSGWAGDTAGVADINAAETTLTVGKANALSAVFVDAHHDPITTTVVPGANGSWFDAACWIDGKVPQEGDTVLLTPSDGSSISLTLTAPTPPLAKLVVSNGADNATATLACANWTTLIEADEVVVGQGGVIKSASGFYDTAMSNRVSIAAESLTVTTGGCISAENAGWAPGNGTCRQLAGNTKDGQGGAYASLGGDRWNMGKGTVSAGFAMPYGSAEWPYDPGCGKFSYTPTTSSLAQSGGGAIFLDVPDGPVVIDGRVSADCTIEGGSGGSVLIVCATLDGAGEVSANALETTTGSQIGGGSGGRIAVHYDPAQQAAKDTTCRVAFRARGGCGLSPSAGNLDAYFTMYQGGPGTLWFPDARFLSSAAYAGSWPFSGEFVFAEPIAAFDHPELDLVIENGQVFLPELSAFRCRSLTASGDWARLRGLVMSDPTAFTVVNDVTLNGAALKVKGGKLAVGGDLLLGAGAAAYKGGELWTFSSATNAPGQLGFVCAVAGTLSVAANACVYPACEASNNAIPRFTAGSFLLQANGLVDGRSRGSHRGAVSWTVVGGAGTSHAGRGAANSDRSIYCYGDEKHPVCPGSGCDSDGGSVFWLESSGRTLLDGTINCSANGGTAAGSGGSVYLRLGRLLSSSGSIMANGGGGTYPAGGGRIALYWRVGDPSTLTFSAVCGTGGGTFAYPAQDGTVYLHQIPGLSVIVR